MCVCKCEPSIWHVVCACNRKHDIWMEVLLGAVAWQQMFANAATRRKLRAVSAGEEKL